MSPQTGQFEENWLTKWGDLWCRFMHASPTWPIHGHYHCAECGRRFVVPWEVEEERSVQSHDGRLVFGQAFASIKR
jgi:hypothetical protein